MNIETGRVDGRIGHQHAVNGAKASADRSRGIKRSERFRCVATSEKEYRPAELEFLSAIEEYKLRSGKKFPTWSEVLSVVESMGYVKVG